MDKADVDTLTGQIEEMPVSGSIGINEEGDGTEEEAQRVFQLDQDTLKNITEEIKQMAEVDPQDGNVDTPDGFRKFVTRQLKKLSCVSEQTDNASERSAASAPSVRSSTSSQDFRENRTTYIASDVESLSYDFNHPKRGLAVVINNEDFSESAKFDNRPGSNYDASSLYYTLRNLGFKVILYNNLAAWKMVEVLKTAAKEYDHSQADCFVCSVLTHGDQTWSSREWERRGTRVRQDLLFGTDGRALTTKTMVDLFDDQNCPNLTGKPRLFFLQACRGSKYDHGQDVLVTRSTAHPGIRPLNRGDMQDKASGIDGTDKPLVERSTSLSSSVDPPEYHQKEKDMDRTDAKPMGKEAEGGAEGGAAGGDKIDALTWKPIQNVPVSPAPLYKDFLIMYATPPGHFAWRRKNGAWFVQCLCKILSTEMVPRTSLLSLLVQVVGSVAREYQSENPNRPDMHQKKECPVIESMLVKDIFLTKKNP